MINSTKKKGNVQRVTKRGGFKIVAPPKDPARREMLRGPDIGASGGCRTVTRGR